MHLCLRWTVSDCLPKRFRLLLPFCRCSLKLTIHVKELTGLKEQLSYHFVRFRKNKFRMRSRSVSSPRIIPGALTPQPPFAFRAWRIRAGTRDVFDKSLRNSDELIRMLTPWWMMVLLVQLIVVMFEKSVLGELNSSSLNSSLNLILNYIMFSQPTVLKSILILFSSPYLCLKLFVFMTLSNHTHFSILFFLSCVLQILSINFFIYHSINPFTPKLI
jgi:hypothetical protein